MTALFAEWLLRPETLALTSMAFLLVCAVRPVAEYLDGEIPLEGGIDL